jgi:sugar lactone lactonase YvrE
MMKNFYLLKSYAAIIAFLLMNLGSIKAQNGRTVNAATYVPAPNISYTTPVTYTVGTLISPLTPTNTGGNPVNYVSTLAGSGSVGSTDGTGNAASFDSPMQLAADSSGNIYVADYGNNKIRKITPAGVVSTLATNTSFNRPAGVAIDNIGNLYVSDTNNHRIVKITTSGVESILAGSGSVGNSDGYGTAASFRWPYQLTVDKYNNIYLAAYGNNSVRKITPAGLVTTVASIPNGPVALIVDDADNVYVVNDGNNVYKITSGGVVSIFAGSSGWGNVDATGTAASFNTPYGINLDTNGNLYVGDYGNQKIRKITSNGVVTTFAGVPPTLSSVDGSLTTARFSGPTGIAFDAQGKMYVAEYDGNKIRVISGAYTISPSLPAGLSMNPDTGIISGTPTVASAATDYTVTTSNEGGSSSFTISIAIISVQAPVAAAQSFCNGATVADLVATGTDLKWYAAETGGTALEITTALAVGTYYVSQTVSGSESARTSVAITVNNAVAGTVSAGQLIVRGTKPAAISLTGSVGTVQWQVSLGNSTFKNIVGATSSTLTSDQMGVLTSKKFYRAVLNTSCNSATSEVVQVWTTLTTKIQDSQCGKTLASLTTIVSANSVPGANKYRFKVVNGTTTKTIETTSKGFSLTALEDGALLNTTYTISVATQSIGIWSDYGTECTVTTPSGITKIQNSQCGQTLASLTTNVMADAVAGVTNYRFKVVQGETTRFLETTARFFNLKSLDGGVFYNTAYTISVATKYNGNWSNYGTECTVTTPSGLTKIKDSQCGTTLASLSTNVVANAVAGVSLYSFKVVQGGTTRTIEKVSPAFSLKSLVGGASSGTTYIISVATKYNGVWGDYGQACEVTTPGAALPSVSRQAATATVQEIFSDAVSVVAYPNPFDATFKLDFQSSSDANILVSVYDMNGRLLENKEVKSSEINNLELGNELPSGVYNVIITQGIEVKTIRVIKK